MPKSRLNRRLASFTRFVVVFRQMTKLMWSSQPTIFSSIVALQLVQGIIPIVIAWTGKQIFDILASSANSDKFSEILPFVIVQILFLVLSQSMRPLQDYLNSELGRNIQLAAEKNTLTTISSLDGLAYFENPEFYDTIRLATQGAMRSPYQMISIYTNLLRGTVTLTTFIGLLLSINPLLVVFISIAKLPHLFGELAISHQHVALVETNSPKERLKAYLYHLLTNVRYTKEIQSFDLRNHLLDRLLRISRQIHHSHRLQQLQEIKWKVGLETLSSAVSGIAFLVIIFYAFSRTISVGDVILYTSAVTAVQGALSSMVSSVSSANENVLIFSYYNRLIDLPPVLQVLHPTCPIPALSCGIEFKNVSFRYSSDLPWILKDVNMFIPRGKCTALVGLNGSGKTTLVKLLTRLYDPAEGEILWDGIDIRRFDLSIYRKRLSSIFQDFIHYDLTARENIGFGNIGEISNIDRIHQVASDVGVYNIFQSLPDKFDTVLSKWLNNEKLGIDLSGGQWQKIAIARMLMRDVDLMILDEPTSALDIKSESETFGHFKNLASYSTSLLISHRFSTVSIADTIFVVENGSIVENGSHEELLSQGHTYSKLYNMQSQFYS